MEDSEDNLVQCPKCGSIQNRVGKCAKCGMDMASLAGAETIPPQGETDGDTGSREDAQVAGESPVKGRFTFVPDIPRPERTQSGKIQPFEDKSGTAMHETATQDSALHDLSQPAEEYGYGWATLIPVSMPIGKLITLTVITLCIYQIFWFYRNWKILKYHYDRTLQPVKLTLMMLIPFYGIYIVYRQLGTLSDMVSLRTRGFPLIPVFAGWIAVGVLASVAGQLNGGLFLWLLWPASALILVPVQQTLNAYARSIGQAEASRGSRRNWMGAAIVVTVLFLGAGIGCSAIRYRLMEPFRAETAELDTASASTSSETRELLIRYSSYIERSKRLINAKSLGKSDRQRVYDETSRLIYDLPKKLHCLTRSEVAGIKHSMMQFILKDNSLMSRDLANLNIGISEIGVFATANSSPAENKEGLEKCTSEPFDLKAFAEEMKQAKGGAAGSSRGQVSRAAPGDIVSPGATVAKGVASLLKAHQQETGTISTDAGFLLEKYGDKVSKGDRRADSLIADSVRQGAVHISAEGNSYRIAVESRLRGAGGAEVSKWTVCSGTIGQYETIGEADQAPQA